MLTDNVRRLKPFVEDIFTVNHLGNSTDVGRASYNTNAASPVASACGIPDRPCEWKSSALEYHGRVKRSWRFLCVSTIAERTPRGYLCMSATSGNAGGLIRAEPRAPVTGLTS